MGIENVIILFYYFVAQKTISEKVNFDIGIPELPYCNCILLFLLPEHPMILRHTANLQSWKSWDCREQITNRVSSIVSLMSLFALSACELSDTALTLPSCFSWLISLQANIWLDTAVRHWEIVLEIKHKILSLLIESLETFLYEDKRQIIR